jgi:hypothetical protein
MRDGMKVSGLMLIQNASDSIKPPLPEHQRRNRNVSGNSIGVITSIIVRERPQRVGGFKSRLAQLVLADVLDVARGGVESQPAVAIDIDDPSRPLALEHVGIPVRNGHEYFVQRHRRLPVAAPAHDRGCPRVSW